MKFILIGNYPADKQESMERFALMLASGLLEANIDAFIWRPIVLLGKIPRSTNAGLGKWLGYIDKWLLFPIVIKWRLLTKKHNITLKTHFHICDHSNAPYLKFLPSSRTAITCHDVLAIRGALGYADAYCPASPFGKVLQKWILNSLKSAESIACVSKYTLNQLKEITESKGEKHNWTTIYNALNNKFNIVDLDTRKLILEKLGIDKEQPFLLHVGSNLKRKNRSLLLYMLNELKPLWSGYICFAGEGVDEDLNNLANSLQLKNRIITIVKPTNLELQVLYNTCEAFIFPSFSEGFGWPIIEAQACGAPVIASNIEPMPEVSGGVAIYANPSNPQDFAKAFLELKNKQIKDDLVAKGQENCSRFSKHGMISSYLNLHSKISQ